MYKHLLHEAFGSSHASLSAYNLKIIVLDASSQENISAKIFCNQLNWYYYHFPDPSCNSPTKRISFALNQFGPLLSTDWIDICSDEDLYCRFPEGILDNNYHFIMDSCFGWIFWPNIGVNQQDLLFLRDMSLRLDTSSIDTNLSIAIAKQADLLSQTSFPEFFWGLLRADIFMLRHKMHCELETMISANNHKIVEIFIGIFQSFSLIKFNKSFVRFRNFDMTQALRNQRADQAHQKRSFSQIYNYLVTHEPAKLTKLLQVLQQSIYALINDSKDIKLPTKKDLLLMVQKSVNSYGHALAYDFNNRAYIFDIASKNYANNSKPMHIYRLSLNNLKTSIFNVEALNPLYIVNQIDPIAIGLRDSHSPFSSQQIVRQFYQIPLEYWRSIPTER